MRSTLLAIFFCATWIMKCAAQNIPNYNFEKWNAAGQQEYVPDGWITNAADVSHGIERENPGYAGSYALKLNANAYAETGFAVTAHPGAIGFYVHTGYMLNDTVSIEVTVYKNGYRVDGGYWVNNRNNPISNWVGATIPVTQNNPSADSVKIHITGGQKPGTYISVDGFMFTAPGSGVMENSLVTNWQVFPNPASDYVELRYTVPVVTNLTLRLYGNDGQLVQTYKQNEITQPGSYTERLDLSNNSRGNFSLEFFNGTERKRLPLVIK